MMFPFSTLREGGLIYVAVVHGTGTTHIRLVINHLFNFQPHLRGISRISSSLLLSVL